MTAKSQNQLAPLPIATTCAGTYLMAVRAFRRRLIEATLLKHNGNRTRAARELGLQRTYLTRLIRELGIHVPVK